MIQLPSYILPKFEIITSYGCRGFRSSENEEKLYPKVFENAMRVYNECGKSFLNVYSRNKTSNDVIEVCSPRRESYLDLSPERICWGELRHNKSSVCFWFRKKFPEIALWCDVRPQKHLDNMVLDFKFNVLVNGTKHLTSSCVYIFYAERETGQILCCDLQCRVEGVFSENEWNFVEIFCEIEHLIPCDSKRLMAYQYWTTKNILKNSFIYVYLENEEDGYHLCGNSYCLPSTEDKFQEMREIKE
ncbi:hypothetical protein MtrunA17_Chr3g0084741 [Medicago truncatula]|uniref:Uncharacterized protein n=1 Tax=Medicago truncatula TaxID=3880 RepID=G7IW60_MEDTR|nr:hypothetical protein MTR_3g020500 [Medicago truncatula]RHN65881.1 hypothetical protein MtrunA17_Chr3g0084741 [Medicago truncatula]